MSEPGLDRGAGGLLADAMTNVSNLVRNEVDLARAEISENLSRAGVAVGLLAGAGVLAIVALNVLAAAAVAALAEVGMNSGLAALLVAGVVVLIALLLLSKGMRDLKLSSLAPTRTVKNVKRDARAVKEGLQ